MHRVRLLSDHAVTETRRRNGTISIIPPSTNRFPSTFPLVSLPLLPKFPFIFMGTYRLYGCRVGRAPFPEKRVIAASKKKRLRENPRNSFASTICIRRHSRAAVCTHFQTRDMGVRETDGKVFSFYFTPILRRCFLSFSVITFSGRRKKMGWHFI